MGYIITHSDVNQISECLNESNETEFAKRFAEFKEKPYDRYYLTENHHPLQDDNGIEITINQLEKIISITNQNRFSGIENTCRSVYLNALVYEKKSVFLFREEKSK